MDGRCAAGYIFECSHNVYYVKCGTGSKFGICACPAPKPPTPHPGAPDGDRLNQRKEFHGCSSVPFLSSRSLPSSCRAQPSSNSGSPSSPPLMMRGCASNVKRSSSVPFGISFSFAMPSVCAQVVAPDCPLQPVWRSPPLQAGNRGPRAGGKSPSSCGCTSNLIVFGSP
jgi:hypothetical protein